MNGKPSWGNVFFGVNEFADYAPAIVVRESMYVMLKAELGYIVVEDFDGFVPVFVFGIDLRYGLFVADFH